MGICVKDKPIAFDAYEQLADAYAAMIDTKPHNAYLERPATLSLLPEVKGKRVLDAGCGPGVYSEWLVRRGAEVVAVDASPRMVELAKDRLGNVDVRLHDLRAPLDFLEDASVDLVLAPLVMDYIEDWVPVFREFYRILRRGGLFVFSMEHPFAKGLWHKSEDYYKIERVELLWVGFGTPVSMPSFKRPLEVVVDSLFESGFRVERILEPRPTLEFKGKLPEDYEKLSKQPSFMCVKAKKLEALD
jgi:SAM-dependent methyltransferase